MLYLTIIGGAFVTWLSVSVLVVDGDKHARDFVRTTLEQYGAIVVTAASAGEARARFKREPPDVASAICIDRSRGSRSS